jgi:hypothetical protein
VVSEVGGDIADTQTSIRCKFFGIFENSLMKDQDLQKQKKKKKKKHVIPKVNVIHGDY